MQRMGMYQVLEIKFDSTEANGPYEASNMAIYYKN